jgi:hypothetical protein
MAQNEQGLCISGSPCSVSPAADKCTRVDVYFLLFVQPQLKLISKPAVNIGWRLPLLHKTHDSGSTPAFLSFF